MNKTYTLRDRKVRIKSTKCLVNVLNVFERSGGSWSDHRSSFPSCYGNPAKIKVGEQFWNAALVQSTESKSRKSSRLAVA